MYKKLFLSVGLLFASFLTGYATAQSYYLNQASRPQASPDAKSKAPQSEQTQAQQLEDKKNQALNNQLKEELAKIPPPPPPPPPHAENSTTPETGQAAPTAKEGTPNTTPPPPTEQATKIPTPTQTAPTPPQTQIYSGFQDPDSSDTHTTPSPTPGDNSNQPASNGWNIQY